MLHLEQNRYEILKNRTLTFMPTQSNTQPSQNDHTYEDTLLKLTALGGVRVEGLDRMQVTVKTELKNSERPPIRHSFDLYNDTQLERHIRKLAVKLEVGVSVLEAAFAAFIDQLEKYRLRKLDEQRVKKIEVIPMKEGELKEARHLLKDKNLLDKTGELIGRSGIVGELVNRLVMLMIFTSRKRPKPLHIISFGSSGTGKTHLQESVAKLIPDEDKIEITTLSENAFLLLWKTGVETQADFNRGSGRSARRALSLARVTEQEADQKDGGA